MISRVLCGGSGLSFFDKPDFAAADFLSPPPIASLCRPISNRSCLLPKLSAMILCVLCGGSVLSFFDKTKSIGFLICFCLPISNRSCLLPKLSAIIARVLCGCSDLLLNDKSGSFLYFPMSKLASLFALPISSKSCLFPSSSSIFQPSDLMPPLLDCLE